MKKAFQTFVFCFILTLSFGQKQRKISMYLATQYNKTMYDITKGNNPWGAGIGLQTFLNNKTKFKPFIEFTADIYLEDDKIYRMYTDGTLINDVPGMVCLFFGTSFSPFQNIYLSFSGGPSFINGQTLLGIKPAIGIYFPKSQKWMAKFAFINIFDRDKLTKNDFGSISVSIGFRLF